MSKVMGKRVAGLVVGVILAMVGVVYAFNLPGVGKYEKVKVVNGTVSIQAGAVSDGKAHFYRFVDGNKEIKFFLVKGADGSIKTAFDACDVCYREKKGYEQQGDVMLCRNCNKKFAIDRIGPHTVGGCNPSYLPSRQEGSSIIITAADLHSGGRFF